MNDISHVVQAMLKRLRADLLQDDVAVALHAFDLLAWESSNNHVHLHTRLKQLCKMLRIDSHHVVPAIAAGAQVLLPLMSRARQQRFPVENRACWSWLLHPSWRAKYAAKLQWTQDCSFLVQFYLSLKMNTTTLERDLGQLLLHLDAHSGPLSSTGSTMASIMEVNIEGPQSEEGFFRPNPDGGPLEPTEFGRLCAKLWLQHFGRRFRYSYKTKKVKAKTVHSPRPSLESSPSRSMAHLQTQFGAELLLLQFVHPRSHGALLKGWSFLCRSLLLCRAHGGLRLQTRPRPKPWTSLTSTQTGRSSEARL